MSKMYCKFCGNINTNDSVYCQFCGKRIASHESNTIKHTNVDNQPNVLAENAEGSHLKEVPPSQTSRSRAEQTEWLRSIGLEQQADQKEKSVSCLFVSLILLIGTVLGLYYNFVTDFLFEYEHISPIMGLFLFVIISIILVWIMSVFYARIYWGQYNKVILEARKEIDRRINEGIGSPEELERMRTHLVERKLNNIENKKLTEDEFYWYNHRYCWLCNARFVTAPYVYTYHRRKEEKWKSGVLKHYQTFHKYAKVRLCAECEKRIREMNSEMRSRLDRIPDIEDFLNTSQHDL